MSTTLSIYFLGVFPKRQKFFNQPVLTPFGIPLTIPFGLFLLLTLLFWTSVNKRVQVINIPTRKTQGSGFNLAHALLSYPKELPNR